jgi:hypothetical protein
MVKKMNRHFLPCTINLLVLLCYLITGCATTPQRIVNKDSVPPKVDISPEIELSAASATGVSAVMDMNGTAHILLALSDPHELQYLIINPQGLVHNEIIRKTGSFENLDAAFDRKGRLHAIVDAEHLIYEGGEWRTVPENPCKKFVQGGKDLVCTFTIKGVEVGSPGRWDIYGFGGPGAGCIWPWYTHPVKFVLMRETLSGWSDWTILDRNTKLDLETFKAVSDDYGTVHVVYQSGRGGVIAAGAGSAKTGPSQIGYARLESTSGIWQSDSGDVRDPDHRDPKRIFAETQGDVINLRGFCGLCGDSYDVVVDRETGILLVAYRGNDYDYRSYNSCLIQNGLPIDCKTDFVPGSFIDIYLASGVEHGFHAVVKGVVQGSARTLHYLEYRNNNWSSTVEVGDYVNGWRAWELVKLISDRSGRALLIWPKEGKRLSARWIEPSRQH